MSSKAAEKKTDDKAAAPEDGDKAEAQVQAPRPGQHWTWKDGAWVEEPIKHATDAEYRRLMRYMPATAWNMLGSAFDQAGFRPTQNEDVALVKAFLTKVTRHPQFQADLKDAMLKRSQG